MWGTFLCALLVLFAMAAKTALYQTHHRSVQTLTAAKVWAGKESVPTPAVQAPVLPAACLLAFIFLLFAPMEKMLQPVSRRAAKGLPQAIYSPPLAVRPPPSIQ